MVDERRNVLFCTHEKLCGDALELMKKKNQDYGANDDPYRNFHQFGLLGILVRMSDKLARLQTFSERGSFAVNDEGLEDTVKDLINYAVLYYGYANDNKRG